MLKKNLKTKIKKYIYQMQGHDLEPKPNEPSTINLQKIGEKARLFASVITANKDLKYK